MMKTIEGYTYKINESIGKGYSSTVHKGTNDQTGEEVSIKVIEMSKLEDPINQMLLQQQVNALKILSFSPYVLHLYDVYATKNNTYIITELCEGDLASLLKKRKHLPYYQAVEVLRQLISGYMDVHRSGFLHRDIKPANIFHKKGQYKLGDFGFAIPIAEAHNHTTYNVGSPVYMPPEALKDNLYSPSCDTWALGVIFFQMLRGSVPWRALSENQLHEKLITQPLDTLSQGFPEVARSFLAQVLQLDPKLRLTPEQLLMWPSKLSAVQINFHLNAKPQILREIKNHSFTAINNPRKQRSTSPNKHSSSTQKYFTKQGKDDTKTKQEGQQKDTAFICNSMINYVKFIHRILNFVGEPTPLALPTLRNALTKQLFSELDNLQELTENKVEYNHRGGKLKLDKWDEFVESSAGKQFFKKTRKYVSKYRMFHQIEPGSQEVLSQSLIREAVQTIMDFLAREVNFLEKLVIAADYLTTMYQLQGLKAKYDIKEFLKISKIDLIVQGNPYGTSRYHLEQLRKKINLISL